MKTGRIKGNIMVKLLVLVISISVLSTAILNIDYNNSEQVYCDDISSLMAVRAKGAFDKIGYHFKLAGYANTNNQNPMQINHNEKSDTLILRHNDVEIMYYVNHIEGCGALYESIDGSVKIIIDGVESLRYLELTPDIAQIEITLVNCKDNLPSKIARKSYSTTVRLKKYL
ncbi:MAG: hypothetical protein J7K40_00375 [candidate division Zixibacteria bacterium]|nr:hypothetical protein [candidate division Zixibacteria bacterium]